MNKIIVDAVNVDSVRKYTNNIDDAISKAQKEILSQAQRYKNSTIASRMGFVAEEVHIGSFNIDSAFKRSSLKAVKEKNGFHGDYKVIDGDKIVSTGEFKHYNNAKNSENAMRGYGDRKLVGASEQVADIKKIAKKRALKNKMTRPEVSKEHTQVGKNVTDKIEKDGVFSKPKTLKQQRKITKQASKGKVDVGELLPDFKTNLKSSAVGGAMEGAKTGALFGGGVSVVSNVYDIFDGKKTKTEAVVDVSKDVVKSTADSAVKNAVGSVAKTASTHLATKVTHAGAKKVLGSSAPVIAGMVAVDTCKDIYKFANGDIDGGTVVKNTGKNVATAGGAWAGAEGGAAIGAMVGGPVGAAVGGVVGSIAGAIGIGSLFG